MAQRPIKEAGRILSFFARRVPDLHRPLLSFLSAVGGISLCASLGRMGQEGKGEKRGWEYGGWTQGFFALYGMEWKQRRERKWESGRPVVWKLIGDLLGKRVGLLVAVLVAVGRRRRRRIFTLALVLDKEDIGTGDFPIAVP